MESYTIIPIDDATCVLILNEQTIARTTISVH